MLKEQNEYLLQETYRKAFHAFSPSPAAVQSLHAKMARSQPPRRRRYRLAAVCAGILLLAGGVTFGSLYHTNSFHPENPTVPTPGISQNADGIVIPQMKLPESADGQADMLGLIVYQGRIYVSFMATVDQTKGEALLGTHLGVTKGNIDEWSKQSDYAVEFASSIGKADVYTVKGYDPAFRIMSRQTDENGQTWMTIFECDNGITIRSGEDWFGKMNLSGNLQSASWMKAYDWYRSGPESDQSKAVELEKLSDFVAALNTAQPVAELSKHYEDEFYGFADSENMIWLQLTTKDGISTTLFVHRDGYVRSSLEISFKLPAEITENLWKSLC